jgi:hypothetical protein
MPVRDYRNNTIYVTAGSSIQTAINAAAASDTIQVARRHVQREYRRQQNVDNARCPGWCQSDGI